MNKLLIVLFSFSLLLSKSIITPIPNDTHKLDPKKVSLGKKLFFEKKFSADNTISCASCHDIYNGGANKNKIAIGINGFKGTFNVPTILNSKYNFAQSWDGREKSLEKQMINPIHNPLEMGSSFPEIIKKLSKNSNYIKEFKSIYNSPITKENIINSIVEFEKALITPNSKFDKYLKGQKEILTKKEKIGYKLFQEYGCISCHNGRNIGGNLFQKVGIISDYFPNENKHFGRYNLTKEEEDKFYFKVPTLRNIELTSPYLHDGSVKSLKEVIEVMLKYQIGAIYTKQDIEYIEEFLKTLTGEKPNI